MPKAKKKSIVLDKQGGIKCYVQSPPERGAANREVLELFAAALHLKLHQISIIKGLTSRMKVLMVDAPLTYLELLKLLGLEERQRALF